MTTYTPTAYLLDHTQITSTAHKLYTFVDTQQWSRLSSSEVFHPKLSLDYTAMFGGEPTHDATPRDLVETQWRPLMASMVSTHHMMASVLVEGLPAPGDKLDDANVDAEGKAEVKTAKVTMYVIAHLTKRKDGELLVTSNGGIGSFEFVKMGLDECRDLVGESFDGTRWRIKSMKVVPKWYEGDVEVLGKVVPL